MLLWIHLWLNMLLMTCHEKGQHHHMKFNRHVMGCLPATKFSRGYGKLLTSCNTV